MDEDIFKYLLGGAGTGLLARAYGELGDIGERGLRLGTELAEEQIGQAQFRPYTITTGTGGTFGTRIDPTTGQLSTTMAYSPQEQALSQALLHCLHNCARDWSKFTTMALRLAIQARL